MLVERLIPLPFTVETVYDDIVGRRMQVRVSRKEGEKKVASMKALEKHCTKNNTEKHTRKPP